MKIIHTCNTNHCRIYRLYVSASLSKHHVLCFIDSWPYSSILTPFLAVLQNLDVYSFTNYVGRIAAGQCQFL